MRVTRDSWGGARRWLQGTTLAAALAVGVLAGLMVGTRACTPAAPPGVQEDEYLVLLATLYSHGESLDSIRSRLNSIGYDNAAEALASLSEEYAVSKDRKQQRQAEDLRQLADALLGEVAIPTLAARATATPTGVAGEATAAGPAAVTPSVQAAEAPPTSQPAASAAPTATSSPAPPPSGRGVIQTSDGTSARLRTQPTVQTTDNVIAGLPPGTEVELLELVEGDPIDPAESRWYKVKHGEFTGYVYYKLVKPVE